MLEEKLLLKEIQRSKRFYENLFTQGEAMTNKENKSFVIGYLWGLRRVEIFIEKLKKEGEV